MMLLHYIHTAFFSAFSSSIIILTFILAMAAAQSIDDQVAELPTCATTCLSNAAANVNCGAGDFACQCQDQDGIVGALGRVSSQATCLMSDCGISNATTTRKVFKNICAILLPSSSSTSGTNLPVSTNAIAIPSTSDQIFVPSTTTKTDLPSVNSVDIKSTNNPVVPTIAATSSSSESISTIIQSSTSDAQAAQTISAIPIQSSQAPTTLASSTIRSTTSTSPFSTESRALGPAASSTSATSIDMNGTAKMSPIAEANSYNPTQAGSSNLPDGLTKTKKLSTGALIGIIVGAVVIMGLVLVMGFFMCRRKKSLRNQRFLVVRNEKGPSRSEYGGEKRILRMEKVAFPPNDERAETPTSALRMTAFGETEQDSVLNPAFSPRASSVPQHLMVPEQTLPNKTYTRASHIQNHGRVSSALNSFMNQRNSNHKSTSSSFVPANPNHKSAASSFFATIPILLDSRVGHCDDCLDNREKYWTKSPMVMDDEDQVVTAPGFQVPVHEGDVGASYEVAFRNALSEVQSEFLVARIGSLSSLGSEERASTVSGAARGLSGVPHGAEEYGDQRDITASLDELTRQLTNINEPSNVKPSTSNSFLAPALMPLFTLPR